MVDSITDQYPMETLSFDNLPQESPVSYLDYGGTLTYIGELVKEKRKENRIKRREFLIKKINNINLGILIDNIKTEAENLKSYRSKEWNKGPSTKTNYKKFFQSHDISLKYLEDMFEVQSKGNHDLEWKIRSIIRWNAAIMVMRANQDSSDLGGHISSFASSYHVSLHPNLPAKT